MKTNLRTSAVTAVLALLVIAGGSADAALVAYFPLDGIAGDSVPVIDDIIDDPTHNVTDGVGNNSNATWVNDVTRGSVLRTPDGNFFNAGTQGINLNDGFTWSFWANVDSTENGSHSIIGTRQGAWHKITTASGVDGTGFADFASGAYDVRDDQWHHFGYIGDLTGVQLYIDGVFIGQDTSLVTNIYEGNMQIGGTPSFSETVNALMDDIAIWNERLTVAQIQALAAGAPVIVPTVPEPATATLALLGLGGLVMRRRRNAA